MNNGANGEPKRNLDVKPEKGIIGIENFGDYTAETAPNRTFFLNLKILRFGTPDALQGAAILIAVLMLPMGLAAFIAGFWDAQWAKEGLAWLASPFSLAVGVAVGRAERSNSDKMTE